MQLKYLGATVGSFLVLAACTGGGSKTGQGGSRGSAGQGGGGEAAGGSAEPGAGGQGVGGSANGGTSVGGNGGTTPSGGTGGNAGGSKTGGTNTGGANTGGTPNTGGVATGAACATDARCDDIEKYNAGAKPAGEFSSYSENGGTFTVSTDKAFSGTKALKFTLPAGTSGKTVRMQHKGYGLLPRDEIYMRAMVFVETRIGGMDPFHWNIMQVEGNSGNIVTGGNNSYKTFQHGVVGGRDCFSHGGNLVPIGRWACWEFHVNGATNDVQSFFDGKLDIFTEVTGGDPIPGGSGCLGSNASGWAIPNVQRAIFGFSSAHPMTTTATIYLDDIALSDKRIGCPPKP
jgi:hypothetical protein